MHFVTHFPEMRCDDILKTENCILWRKGVLLGRTVTNERTVGTTKKQRIPGAEFVGHYLGGV